MIMLVRSANVAAALIVTVVQGSETQSPLREAAGDPARLESRVRPETSRRCSRHSSARFATSAT